MTPITDEVIDQAEAIGAISFEMSSRVRSELATLRARVAELEALEVNRLRDYADMRNFQHKFIESDHKLRDTESRLTAAEAENGRLRECNHENTIVYRAGNENAWCLRCGYFPIEKEKAVALLAPLQDTVEAALAPVTEPQAAQAGEREALAEALIAWAADKWGDFEDYFCKFCNADITIDYAIGADGKMFDLSKEIVICKHAPDCLHLRAKALRALRADAGGSEAVV